MAQIEGYEREGRQDSANLNIETAKLKRRLKELDDEQKQAAEALQEEHAEAAGKVQHEIDENTAKHTADSQVLNQQLQKAEVRSPLVRPSPAASGRFLAASAAQL